MVANEELLVELEQSKTLNWCPSSRNVLPLQIEEDGNDLLHSVSMYLFGVHDRKCTLRRMLHKRLVNEKNGNLYDRWIDHNTRVKQRFASDQEWKEVTEAASANRLLRNGADMMALSALHIFTLANILKRSIFVFGDVEVCGVYLPLLHDISACEQSPVLISCINKRFAPLLSSEDINIALCRKAPLDTAQHCVPLCQADGTLLPVPFLKESENRENALHTYLECCQVPCATGESMLDAALLKFKTPIAQAIEMMWSLFRVAEKEFQNLDQDSSTNLYKKHSNWIHSIRDANDYDIMRDNNQDSIEEEAYVKVHHDENIYMSMINCVNQADGCTNLATFNKYHMCNDCCRKATQREYEEQKRVLEQRLNQQTEEESVYEAMKKNNSAPGSQYQVPIPLVNNLETGASQIPFDYVDEDLNAIRRVPIIPSSPAPSFLEKETEEMFAQFATTRVSKNTSRHAYGSHVPHHEIKQEPQAHYSLPRQILPHPNFTDLSGSPIAS
jgi:hypothetical protein